MCLGLAAEIVAILPEHKDLATANVMGAQRTVNIGLLESEQIKPGDWVLIHVGFAISKMTADEAKASIAFMESLGPGIDEDG
jgi:hydrogenase expression/formation protein HypC